MSFNILTIFVTWLPVHLKKIRSIFFDLIETVFSWETFTIWNYSNSIWCNNIQLKYRSYFMSYKVWVRPWVSMSHSVWLIPYLHWVAQRWRRYNSPLFELADCSLAYCSLYQYHVHIQMKIPSFWHQAFSQPWKKLFRSFSGFKITTHIILSGLRQTVCRSRMPPSADRKIRTTDRLERTVNKF